ncbi:MAG TPA: PVC-type heme-binding CxxCH protein [Gemmataceae bacterium]|nr:PVC-type heme-binding CxxCH protein [Gemmataceae bacterium]
MVHRLFLALVLILLATARADVFAADGNRLCYLDGSDPYYVSRTFPRLVTPQWVGEDGVEAVVILAIDDMRGHEKWEAFLRPILQRLKRIDGRAPVSIMTNQIDPKDPHLQKWLKEGLSLETHTLTHPCPLLKDGSLAKAKADYDRCVDLLARVPHSRPVAFRMPCCDSLNTLSPRFFGEVFNRTTPKGNFLTVDSSVFNIITANDADLPRDLVLDPDGREKFRKYVPYDRSFANTIEDYPYPYVIDRLCWEFPCVTPSDWEADHLRKANNAATVRDWKAGLDAVVRKQGVFTMVFHPWGWIDNRRIIELIDHAVARHGRRVKFLTFREAQERLNKHLLGGQALRAANGQDNGVRLLDVNNDGYLDVVIGNDKVRQTRVWSPRTRSWTGADFPVPLVTVDGDGNRSEAGVRFGVLRPDGHASCLVRNDSIAGAWHWDGAKWVQDKALLGGLEVDDRPVYTSRRGRDRGVRLRDLDRDGRCELIVGNDTQQAVFAWSPAKKAWQKLPFTLPHGTAVVDARGKDAGLRFMDIDEDGHDDVIFSNEERYSLHLFTSMRNGWGRQALSGKRSDPNALPMIVRKGTDNGAWFHSRTLWVQNENTALLKDLVERRSFNEILASVDPTAKTPEASLRCLRPRPGFVAELVVTEPLVQDPIAFAWGPDGKLWVVEMSDYPLGTDGKGKAGGRIKYLESTHGDGKYDKATLFLDGLSFPTGVVPWRKGVLVTCAPDILYAEAGEGGGKADRKVALYTGLVQGNPQHRVNSLVWGLDNWIHCANGNSGGRVRSVKTGKEVDIRGRDFRIRPDDGGLDAEAGETQYGRSRDDWGNWFGCSNSNPMWHVVLSDHYLRRNPHVAPPDPRVQVSITPGAARVYPVSRTQPRFNDPEALNHFTSACSVIVYRDELFGPAFANNTFVSEPVHNLVHREVMTPKGITFTSRRAADEQESEFLASSDNWTRPTTIQTGPDGALWMADMYRYVIEHPEWIPIEWQKKLDLRAGSDLGRIYRVYPVGSSPRAVPRLDRLDIAGLVAALDSPSGWQRDLAQQVLLWRRDKSAVPLLERLADQSKRPLARLHALCTLDGLNALTTEVLGKGLADGHAGVRRHALRLCDSRLDKSPELGTAVVKLLADPDSQVRLQLAYTLGEWDDPRAGRALGLLAVKVAGDRYLSAAVMSSVNRKNLEGVLLAALKDVEHGAPPAGLVENLLRLADALGEARATVTLLQAVTTPDKGTYASWQFAALASLLDGLGQRNSSLERLAKDGDDEVKAAVRRCAALFAAARAVVADQAAERTDQVQAIRLLGRGLDHREQDLRTLADLLVPQTPDDLQAAAVTALGLLRDPRVPERLLRGWKSHGPGLRSQVLGVLFGRTEWVKAVLDAVENKQVPAFEIDAGRRQLLLQHRDSDVRRRAARLFAGAVHPDRQKVIDDYRPVLTLKGDADRGLKVFTKNCSTCHRLGDVGHEVGPDLASVADKGSEYLLTNILDPNRAVEPQYISYVAETKNGLLLTGVLTAETGNSITLIGQDGKRQVILRTDLESLSSTGKSAMPEGLEKDIKHQDMADLIVYLRASRPAQRPKVFEGNKPELVRPTPSGSLHLSAADCEIYGRTLVLEKQYGNLGYWSSEDDRAVWTVDVVRPGRYVVWLDCACADNSAGNTFMLEAGGKQLTGKVASTGNWDTYRPAKVGTISLPAGKQQVVLRPAGKVSGALIDLRSVRLVPESANK